VRRPSRSGRPRRQHLAPLAQHHKGALLFRQVPTLRAYAMPGVTMSRLLGRASVEG
jgi:hypothetical protein